MKEFKITRWATYLVPGSIVVFAFWILIGSLVSPNMFKEDRLAGIHQSMVIILGLIFCVISYMVGIGLWGLAYSDLIQKTLLGNPHKKREGYVKDFLIEPWKQKKYYAQLKQYFPEVPEEKGRPENFEYRDFQFVIVSVLEKAGDVMKNRIVTDRDTIGILQSLILASYTLCIVFGIVAIKRWQQANGELALIFVVLTLATVWIIFTLYVHFFRRNYYLVRDVLMAFLM